MQFIYIINIFRLLVTLIRDNGVFTQLIFNKLRWVYKIRCQSPPRAALDVVASDHLDT